MGYIPCGLWVVGYQYGLYGLWVVFPVGCIPVRQYIGNHVNTDFDENESKLTNAHQKSIEFRKSYDEVCFSI